MRGTLEAADLKEPRSLIVTILSGRVFQRTMVRGKKEKLIVVLSGNNLTKVKGMMPSRGSGGVGVVWGHLHSNQLVHNFVKHNQTRCCPSLLEWLPPKLLNHVWPRCCRERNRCSTTWLRAFEPFLIYWYGVYYGGPRHKRHTQLGVLQVYCMPSVLFSGVLFWCFRFMNPNDLFALLVMLSICGVQSSLLAMVIPKYLACGVISSVCPWRL